MREKIMNVQLPITQHIQLTPFSRSSVTGDGYLAHLIAMNEINSYSILILRIRKRSKLWKFYLIFLTRN